MRALALIHLDHCSPQQLSIHRKQTPLGPGSFCFAAGRTTGNKLIKPTPRAALDLAARRPTFYLTQVTLYFLELIAHAHGATMPDSLDDFQRTRADLNEEILGCGHL
ncbi:MAG TPA: hypothetical protein VFR42_07645, partial [Candidatus Acidoferrum sp.]|nr:hypothetical protein [Candidatus Acidoferrum sp.]